MKNQTDSDFSLIVVDNGSYDDSLNLMKRYFPKALTCRYYVRGHRSEIRNIASRMCNRSHMIFLDCDLIVYPNFIENYRKFITRNPDALGQGLYFPYLYVLFMGDEFIANENGQERIDLGLLERMVKLFPAFGGQHFGQKVMERNNVPYDCDSYAGHKFYSGNFCVSKRVYESIGGFDSAFHGYGHEDTMFGISALHKGVEKFVVNNVSCIHQNHRGFDDDSSTKEDSDGTRGNEELLKSKIAKMGFVLGKGGEVWRDSQSLK